MSGKMLDMARKIGKTLYRVDWINFIGQVLLLPIMPYKNKHPSLEEFSEYIVGLASPFLLTYLPRTLV